MRQEAAAMCLKGWGFLRWGTRTHPTFSKEPLPNRYRSDYSVNRSKRLAGDQIAI